MLCAAILFCGAHVFAQSTTDEQPIKVNTVLVNIPVVATDARGRYVSGLKRESFSVLQDGEKQSVDFFADERAPMNVVLLIDASGSTMRFLNNIKSAARDFVKVFRPEDRGMIVSFAGETRVEQEFTSDQKKLHKAIDQIKLMTAPGSNMQDALHDIVAKSFARADGRKAVIVLTDGYVTGKATSDEALLNTLAAADIPVYAILFDTEHPYQLPNLAETVTFRDGTVLPKAEAAKRLLDTVKNQMDLMSKLGPATGGKLLTAKQQDFKEAFRNIAEELKDQYVIGFYPQNEDGRSHEVQVSVDAKDIVIRSKRTVRAKAAVDH